MTTQAYVAKQSDTDRFVFCVIGHDGRLTEISANAHELLGWDTNQRQTRLQDCVHHEDVHLLTAFLAASLADQPISSYSLRVRGRSGQWIRVRCYLSPLAAQHPLRYAVVIKMPDSGAERPDERGLCEDWWTDPALVGLSERQAEVLRRIVRGEGVPAIARELVITASTVRNHLSAIYRKFGVNSQSALMLRLIPRISR